MVNLNGLKKFGGLALNILNLLPGLIHGEQTNNPDAPGSTKESNVLAALGKMLANAIIEANPQKVAAIKELIAAIVVFKNKMAAIADEDPNALQADDSLN